MYNVRRDRTCMITAVRPVGTATLYTAIAAVLTWPLAAHLASAIPSHDDVLFSIWRLAWIAHQLPRDPLHLFDANIFFPARDTLAFSDAMLLQGLLAAPLIWMSLHPLLVQNLLLMAGLIGSALGAYVLCLSITHDRAAAFLGGLIFAFAPYRFAHIGHLELQWAMWMPLAVLALLRTFAMPSARAGVLLGLTVAAQFLSSLYYGVLLSSYLAIAAVLLTVLGWRAGGLSDAERPDVQDPRVGVFRRSGDSPQPRLARRLGALVLGALVVTLLLGPYLVPYARARATVGARSEKEVSDFSAVPADYLRVGGLNLVYGRTFMGREGIAPDERTLFPGMTALALVVVALWPRSSRAAVFYTVLLVFAVDMSFGPNGIGFGLLRALVPPLQSLRALARSGVLALLSISVLASMGFARLARANLLGPRPRLGGVGVAALCLIEYFSAPLATRSPALVAAPVDTWLAGRPQHTVVLELPAPVPSTMWLYEAHYQYASIYHWRQLVNGYSGFAPPEHLRTLELLKGLPDGRSVERIRELGVDYVIVHEADYGAERYAATVTALSRDPAFAARAVFGGLRDEVMAFAVVKNRR